MRAHFSPTMNRLLAVLVLLCCALARAEPESLDPAHAKHVAIYAPAPEYPLGARVRHWTGVGLFLCNLRPDGTVASVKVLQSTGHEILDQAGIAAVGGGNRLRCADQEGPRGPPITTRRQHPLTAHRCRDLPERGARRMVREADGRSQTVALFSVLEIILASVSIWNGFCSAGRLRYSSGKPCAA